MQYKIVGEPMPAVICELQNGESMITERGSMSWMSPNMEMRTNAGGVGKALGRLFSGESIFQNTYTANGAGMICVELPRCDPGGTGHTGSPCCCAKGQLFGGGIQR